MTSKKGGEIMERAMNELNRIEIPQHIQKEIGLKKGWQKQISRSFADNVMKTAEKYKPALRKLSKN